MDFEPDEIDRFRQFLKEFSTAHSAPLLSEDPLPIRLICYYLSEEEVEGECLDWSLTYLAVRHCPSPLDVYIAREVAENVLRIDVRQYLQEQTYPDEELQLEASRLAVRVFNTMYDVCRQWNDELPLRKMRKSRLIFDVYVHAIKNTRRKMEDRHVVVPHFNPLMGLKAEPECAFFGVYDGHGGVDAAVYAAAHVHTNTGRQKTFFSDPETALKEAFVKTDQGFVLKAAREGLRSGTTGVSALIQGRKLHVAWLGDSQVMMSRRGVAVQLLEPHKPEREDERKRIESMGGCVVHFGAWRVNGSLSVSRAIGDADHKPYVWGQPDTSTFDLDGLEDFILLACDGLWDVVSRQRVVEIVTSHVRDTGSRDGVAKALVDEAKISGSSDNITVVLVFLDGERNPGPVPASTTVPKLKPGASSSPKLKSSAEVKDTKRTSSISVPSSSSRQKSSARTVHNGRGKVNGKGASESPTMYSKTKVQGTKKSSHDG